MRNYVRQSKNSRTHQKRSGIKEAGRGNGQRIAKMYEERHWRPEDSVTLLALDLRLAAIRKGVQP